MLGKLLEANLIKSNILNLTHYIWKFVFSVKNYSNCDQYCIGEPIFMDTGWPRKM